MSQVNVCQACGTRLSTVTVEGLCPRCLARMTFAGQPSLPAAPESVPGSGPKNTRMLGKFGDYELVEEIARGGMGVVYKGRQLSLNRTVALKVILSGRFASPQAIQRFQAEAEAAANLQHPNIVAIHEVGEHEGQHYFSMDYVDGQSLAEVVRENPLPPRRAAGYVQRIAAAIQYAHEHGTIHRDLKPSNVLIDPFDEPQIADFGLAKRSAVDLDLTTTGQVIGSPNFLSPEQARGQAAKVGPACDIYALGAILYFLVTGRPPFLSESLEETLRLVLNTEPPSPRLLDPGIPRDLETICLKCLAKEPPRRYASARAVAEDLGRFLNHEPILARPAGPVGKIWRWARRNPALSALAFISLTSLLALAIGSPIALVKIQEESRSARRAQSELREKLWESYLAQARALRWSRKAGCRFDSLGVIAQAVAIQPSLALRNEAIAGLALHDIRLVKGWDHFQEGKEFACLNLDRQLYAYGRRAGEISIRRIADEAELIQLPAIGPQIKYLLEFSPDGKYLIALYRDGISRVWHLETGRIIVQFQSHDYGDCNDFSSDGRTLAVCSNLREVDLYDLPGGTRRKSFAVEGQPHFVRFNPSRDLLAVACREEGKIKVIDAKHGLITSEFTSGAPVFELAWHPEGENLVAAGEDRRLYLWHALLGQNLKQWVGHQMSHGVRVAFHPSGRLFVSSGWDGKIRMWSFPDAEELVQISGEGMQLEFDAAGERLGCYGWIGNLPRIYEVAARTVVRTLQKQGSVAHQSEGTIAFSHHGRYLAYPTDQGVKLWELAAGRVSAVLPAGLTKLVFFSSDDSHLYVSGERGFWYWPLAANTKGRQILANPSFDISSGKLPRAAVCEPNWIALPFAESCQLFDLGSLKPLVKTGKHPELRYMAIHPGGEWIATGGWNVYGVRIWDAETGSLVRELKTALSPNVAFTPNGKFLVSGTSDEYNFWQVKSWALSRTIQRGKDHNVQGSIAFSPSNGLIALAHTRNLIRLLRNDTFETIADLESPNSEGLFDLCFSPSGTQLAAMRGADTVELWDLAFAREHLQAMGLARDFPALDRISVVSPK